MRPNPSSFLRRAGTPAFLVSNPVNVGYLTGVHAEGLLALVTSGKFVLFAHSLEFEAAKQHAYKGVTVRTPPSLEKALARVKKCGFEADDVTVNRLARWKKRFPKTSFVKADGVTEHFRRTKDEGELAAVLRANAITEEILVRIPGALRAGITERALAWRIECWARELGAERMSFETIVAFGSHSSRPHHRPSDRVLKKGDIVQIDMGVVVDRYLSDRSEVFFTRERTAEEAKIYEALTEAKNAAIAAIAPGVSAREPDRIAQAVLKKYGLAKHAYDHSLGHGVGLEIHEGISLSERSEQTLLEHEVVTVEPAVYIPGKFGMRLEDMVIVE